MRNSARSGLPGSQAWWLTAAPPHTHTGLSHVGGALPCLGGPCPHPPPCALAPLGHARAGAGLGGGSGNAATTLWAANELTGRPATTAQLLQWSGDIGSDISVFFRWVGSSPSLNILAFTRTFCEVLPKRLFGWTSQKVRVNAKMFRG